MNADIPKQYLKLNNKTIIELDCFLRRKDIKGIAVALARNDRYWLELEIADHEKIITAPGGAERHESALNALHALSESDGYALEYQPVSLPQPWRRLRPCVNGHTDSG